MTEPALRPDEDQLQGIIGRTIGTYCLAELIGKGSMGAVFRAHDNALGRDVAVKVVAVSRENHGILKRLLSEAQTMARLEHPNIVPVYDIGITMPYLYVVMRLLRGKTLLDRINAGLITIDEAVDYVRQIAAGLDHAHTNGVIHRDLKPENVIITEEGCHITDFGLAMKMGLHDDLSRMVVGTPHYIAPEIWRKGEADARSDLYALGVIAYTMFCRRRPFEGTTKELMRQHLTEYPPKPHLVNKAVTPDISDIVMKMLDKSAEHRYQSAFEVAEDCNRFRKGLPVRASTDRSHNLVCVFCGAENESGRKRCSLCNELLEPLKVQVGRRQGEAECLFCGKVVREGGRCPYCDSDPGQKP